MKIKNLVKNSLFKNPSDILDKEPYFVEICCYYKQMLYFFTIKNVTFEIGLGIGYPLCKKGVKWRVNLGRFSWLI